MKLKILPPDVNRFDYHFTVDDGETIATDSAPSRAWGNAAIEGMLQERDGERRIRRPLRSVPARRPAQGQPPGIGGLDSCRRAGPDGAQPRHA